jgi:hypothetical protein
MRKREQEISNGMPHGSEPIPYHLFIYNLNEDIEGMSGKSAKDKTGRWLKIPEGLNRLEQSSKTSKIKPKLRHIKSSA